MARVRMLLAVVLCCGVIGGCVGAGSGSAGSKSRAGGEIISGQGQVRHIELEGGFWGIVAASGKYEPMNLPAEFQVNKRDVVFKARLRPDVKTFHMWGKPIEILEIK
ncbi:MAG: hypothetical protein A2Y12_13490 [Planctomycetes bacterium GWF2_42_9]|nr:MAG: hypothetical protein A2Y12_13490 [Planctomycetes bacterium GWF2_42_9]